MCDVYVVYLVVCVFEVINNKTLKLQPFNLFVCMTPVVITVRSCKVNLNQRALLFDNCQLWSHTVYVGISDITYM